MNDPKEIITETETPTTPSFVEIDAEDLEHVIGGQATICIQDIEEEHF